MESVSKSVLKTFLALALFAIFARAIPDGDASPPASGNKKVLDAPTTPSPEEIAIDEEVKELKLLQCKLVFGNCWMAYAKDKPYFKEERRMKICLKRTRGFRICAKMTEEDGNDGKERAQEKMKIAEEEEEERNRIAEEEKTRLEEKLKEEKEGENSKLEI